MNALMSKMCPSATQMIRMDHAAVLGLYHKLTPQTSHARREAIAREICTALDLHARIEEEIFYPALQQAGVEPELVSKSVPEHDEMRAAIERVRAVPASDPQHAQALAELMQAVLHHMADEEARVLPAAERLLPRQLDELGVRMTERRMELARPNMGRIVMDTARGSPGKTAMLVAGALALGALLFGGMRAQHGDHYRWS